MPRPERWNLKCGRQKTTEPTFDSSSLRSFCLSALKFSVYSFCSIAFSDMQLPHSSQGSFWPHCDDVVRTSREGRVCDFVDSAQRPQRALVEGQNLHCTQKTTWFVAWAQPSSVIFARTSITCIHLQFPTLSSIFQSGVDSDNFIIFHDISSRHLVHVVI